MCIPIMLFLIILLCASAQAQVQVNTTEGLVEGWMTEQDYIAFYGIPYAGPVDGSNRFKAAPPPAQRPEVLNATDTEIICAQPSESGIRGIENCLTLSIFTSNVTTSSRPVVVWLNAEEYTKSNNDIPSFKNFVSKGIVVITLNFRLSIFGFLCLRVEQAPGNAGIKDIIQGLEWINRNIEGFGGDPENVMLMGHGSAAALVDIVTMVPRANNLFHKVVTLSGSALAPWAVAYTPVEYAQAFGKLFNYSMTSNADLAIELSLTNIDLFPSALNWYSAHAFTNNTPIFAPCIEDSRVSPDQLILTDSPINILKSGNYTDIPYIAGYVTKEGTLRAEQAVNGSWLEEIQKDFSHFVPADLDFGTDITNMANSIRDTYFNSTNTIEHFLNYQGDILVVVSVIRGVRERAATSNSQVRLMEFGYMGSMNSDWPYPEIVLNGVQHGGIQNVLFGYDLYESNDLIMQSLVSRISAFANSGVPVTQAQALFLWDPVTTDSVSYLVYEGRIDPEGVGVARERVLKNPQSNIMTYWDLVYARYYKPVPAVNVPDTSSAGQLAGFFYVLLFSFALGRFI